MIADVEREPRAQPDHGNLRAILSEGPPLHTMVAHGRIEPTGGTRVVSLLSPRWARPHLRAIYGFARLVDNLGDEAAGDRNALLDELERELEGPPRTEIMRKVHETVKVCALSREPFARLIEANRIDQVKNRYDTWDEVCEYCTYSADPVGRLVLGIYGRAGEPELVAMSDSVCTGLQLVNFLQDPPRDLALGRVYLPQESLRKFGVADADLAGPLTERTAALLRLEGERARGLLEAGLPLARALGGRPGMSVKPRKVDCRTSSARTGRRCCWPCGPRAP